MVAIFTHLSETNPRELPAFIAMITADLGLLSLLPLPGYDGGHFVGLILDTVRKKHSIPKWLIVTRRIALTIILLSGWPLCGLQGAVKAETNSKNA